jgi:Zn/Cd-binding protein ZinT
MYAHHIQCSVARLIIKAVKLFFNEKHSIDAYVHKYIYILTARAGRRGVRLVRPHRAPNFEGPKIFNLALGSR